MTIDELIKEVYEVWDSANRFMLSAMLKGVSVYALKSSIKKLRKLLDTLHEKKEKGEEITEEEKEKVYDLLNEVETSIEEMRKSLVMRKADVSVEPYIVEDVEYVLDLLEKKKLRPDEYEVYAELPYCQLCKAEGIERKARLECRLIYPAGLWHQVCLEHCVVCGSLKSPLYVLILITPEEERMLLNKGRLAVKKLKWSSITHHSQFAKIRKYPRIRQLLDEGSGEEVISEEDEKKYLQQAIELPLKRERVSSITDKLLSIIDELLCLINEKF